jgi:Holliday junction resolvasome RuvABC ATP-dependent DNA helicase subunit
LHRTPKGRQATAIAYRHFGREPGRRREQGHLF